MSDRVGRPPPRPRIRDGRPVALVPGVANRDARAVFDAHLARLETARRGHPGDPDATARLREALRHVLRTRLWRGKSLTSFEVLTEQLLDLPADEARALTGPVEPASDEAVAVWLRAEAALLEAGLDATVRLVVHDGGERLEFDAPVTGAPRAVAAIARRLAPLGRDLGPPRGRRR